MTLDGRLARLLSMTAAEVKAEWRRVFSTPAPLAFGIALMTRAIAARYQEQAFGGLSKGELRILDRQVRKNERKPQAAPIIKFAGLNLDYSIAKARTKLGYAPRVQFDDGMKAAIAWYNANHTA